MSDFERTVLGSTYVLAEDIRLVLPELYAGLIEDLDELSNRVSARGLGPVLVDLPELGKLYDKGLSSGFFCHKAWPQTLKRSGRKPNLFERIIRCSFFGSDWTCSDPEPELVFFTRSLLYHLKKVDMPCPQEKVLEAVEEFVEVDRGLRSPKLDWLEPHSVYKSDQLRFTDLFEGQKLTDRKSYDLLCLLDQVVGCSPFKKGFTWWSLHPKHGPGAVADLKRGKDKYAFPVWPDKLAHVFPRHYFCSVYGDLRYDPVDSDSSNGTGCHSILSGMYGVARLHDVPKTYKGPRLISVEPTAQQFIQGGLLSWLRANMPKSASRSICFNDQTPSREGALRASIRGDFATVDLSAASDRLSCWTVERAIRDKDLLAALISCRTPFISLERYKDQANVIELMKFAGMGSAVTFPVQSIIYWMCCIAALSYQLDGRKPLTARRVAGLSKKVRVFGDDLILPSPAVPYLALLLDCLQLKINGAKTHHQGHFRESCGMDAYKGVDVTPLYMSRLEPGDTPSSLASWVDIRNNAYTKGLWTLARWMEDNAPPLLKRHIVRSNYELGCLTYLTYLDAVYAKRWRANRSLHLSSVRGLTLRVKVRRQVRGTMTDLLQYFLESPGPDSFWEPGYLSSTSARLAPAWVSLRGRVVGSLTP